MSVLKLSSKYRREEVQFKDVLISKYQSTTSQQSVNFCCSSMAHNDRALCSCGIRIPSARNRCPAFVKDKCLEPMLGDVGHARTNAAILLKLIATTSSRTCTKPIVVRSLLLVVGIVPNQHFVNIRNV